MDNINIFLIDDSVVFRQSFIKYIEAFPKINIIGTANDAVMGEKKLKISTLKPDVIILDIEMPKIDGIDFLKQIMHDDPMRVIVCSSYIESKPHLRQQALAAGALKVIQKPTFKDDDLLSKELIEAIRSVAKMPISNNKHLSFGSYSNNTSRQAYNTSVNHPTKASFEQKSYLTNHIDIKQQSSQMISKIVAIGSSTGGAAVVEKIISLLPNKIPPILIVQHMAPDILSSFVKRINTNSKFEIKIASNNEKILPNTIYFAPGDKHLKIKKLSLSEYHTILTDGEKVSHHKPSVDVLFESFAAEIGNKTVAFILTGMGFDGAQGMKHIKQKGGRTFAQNEKSCVVYGMPKEAVNLGAVDKEISPEDIPYYIAMG